MQCQPKEIQLQNKKSQENASQGSRKRYKRFQPKEVSDTSSKKKKLQFNKQVPKNLVFIKSNSIERDQYNKMPQLGGLTRTCSHAIIRKKTQQITVENPVPSTKQVRFTFGNQPEAQKPKKQIANKNLAKFAEPNLTSYEQLIGKFKYAGKNWRYSQFPIEYQQKLQIATPEQLRKQISKFQKIRKICIQKISQIQGIYLQMANFVKQQLAKHQKQTIALMKTFMIQFQQQIRKNRIYKQANHLLQQKRNVLVSGNKSDPLDRKESNKQSTTPTRLDHANIMNKLDRIKSKLNQMSKNKEEFVDQPTPKNQSNDQEQYPYFIKPRGDAKTRVISNTSHKQKDQSSFH